jgi:hypothetical protein
LNIAELLSPYDRRARLYPSLLAILPLLVVLPAIYGIDPTTVVPMAVVCGVGFLLTRVARNAGVKLQDRLWKSWGGSPTTQLLRHRNHEIDQHTKARYHGILSERLGFALPTAVEEQADMGAADEKYRAAVQLLINLTRNRTRYPLVFIENAAYGFHRNGLGLRTVGVLIALASIFWTLFHAGTLAIGDTSPWIHVTARALKPAEATSLVASGLTLFAWLAVFTKAQVKQTAFAYAKRLIECCDDLDSVREGAR